MFIRSMAAALLTVGIATSQTAFAASVANGSYSGSQANPNAGVSMTVSTDTSTGKPQITGFGLGVIGNCTPSGSVDTGWGFNPGVDFVGNKASFVFSFDYLWVKVSLTVSGDNVTGTIAYDTPIFAPYTKAPAKSLFCKIPTQSFTMTYQGSSSTAAVVAAPHMIIVH